MRIAGLRRFPVQETSAMIRYERLGRVDLNVTDLERSGRFYEEIVGLQRAGEAEVDGSLTFRCGTDNCVVVLHQAPVPGFRSMALALESDQALEALHERLAQSGIAGQMLSDAECQRRQWLQAWRIAEPNTGATFEFYVRQ